ncbi:MAG: WYL domain-containing protein [Candidatus Tectomicrobia bacterium]|nr:WYL domain-containing protein [Candidatus Tectomicrobia bacterium]
MALRDQFVRRWRLLRAFEEGGDYEAGELLKVLAREEEPGAERPWSLRTLQRDLSHLVQAGFPLEGVRKGRKMRYRLSAAFSVSVPEPLRPSEWAALYYALSVLRKAPGNPFREEPVIGSLREQTRLRRVGEALARAIEEGRPVRLLAARPGEPRRRWWRVDPYFLGFEGGSCYLLGRDAERGAIEVWPLQAVETVRAGRGAFQLPLGLDLEGALAERLRRAGGAGWSVRLRFKKGASLAGVAAFLAEAFGAAQRTGGRGDGELTVRTSDLLGLRRWLVGFGPEAEVLAPRELRMAVAQDLEAALGRYKKSGRRPEG